MTRTSLELKSRIRGEIGDPERKRRYVRDLFARVAGRYDLTNDVMSLGLHRRWKRLLLQLADLQPGQAVLDLAAGTGDLAIGAAEQLHQLLEVTHRGSRSPLVVGGDLTREMMEVGRRRDGAEMVRWLACDALALPFGEKTFDRILVGYGLRNFADLDAGLREIRRCLRPGGLLVSLDFGKPRRTSLRRVYLSYLDASTRMVGWALHRDPEAYLYIPESLRQVPGQRGVCERMRRTGFVRCGFVELLFGTMAINFGERDLA